ncbi:MFS transporter [Pseudonocardia sp. KRD291]|uniref:MFS transporter n=1 Tax=Pseudonocardia sp. KRD291 TaxID=2792007 RepID=UPI001C49FE4C|nr:MFS transporter [Pseudonocardia sp. KRD291]MBW0103590.1 MFS transporter [Pseudonocardia sp. KRD291]
MTPDRPRPAGRRAPPLSRGFRNLWAAGALSNLGDGVYLGALPLLAATVSRNPAAVSLVVAAAWLPWLVLGPISGAVADRGDRLRIMIGADLVRALTLCVLGVLVVTGQATIGLLIGLVFALGTAQTLFDSAAQAVIPLVVGRETAMLSRANSRIAAAQTTGKDLAGPPVGSAAFVLGPFVPFLLDAVSFLASAALLRAVRRTGEHVHRERAGRASIRADIVDGMRWLGGHRVVLFLAIVVGLSNLAWVGAESVLVLFALDRLGVSQLWFGALLAAPAVGAIPGAVVAGAVIRRVPPGVVLLGGLLLQALVLAGIGLATDPFAVAGLLAVGGLLLTIWNIAQIGQRQILVPDRLTGRVVASMRMIAYGIAPLGAVAAGAVATALGLQVPYLLSAAVLVLAAVVAAPCLNSRSLRRALAAANDGAGTRAAG